jgi:hypothetical protein
VRSGRSTSSVYSKRLRTGGVPLSRRVSGAEARTVAIWLILPVVIRSSQRLSHACLSINDSIL